MEYHSMVDIIKKIVLIVLYLCIFIYSANADFIKNLSFEWEDGNDPIYQKDGNLTPAISGPDRNGTYGGEAYLKTIRLRGSDDINRTIDANKDFIFPDTYKFNSSNNKTLYYTKTTGYYYCADANKSTDRKECVNKKKEYTTVNEDNEDWHKIAKKAFSSPNLNFYVGGDSGQGIDFTGHNDRNASTVRHLLSYTNGVKVGFAGDGYVIVSERGGNNSFYLLARDMKGNELKHIYIKRADNDHCSENKDNESAYVPSGRMQENPQEICVAVYPIQDLAPPGSTIGSIEMWAASSDAGDGKVMLVHSLEAPNVCYDYSVRQNSHTLDSEDRNFTAVGHGDVSISLALRSMQSDYDMTKAKLRLDVPLSFKKAEYSPNQVNNYIDARYIFDSNTPEIAFGANIVEGEGGTIGSDERYFAKFIYNPPNHGNKINFNFDLNITVDTSEAQNNPIYYLLTTDPDKYNAANSPYRELTRCPISEVYHPAWGSFNVERIDSVEYNPKTEPNKRFPLYTQVAGKDFDFSIVSYDANASPAYLSELAISNTTVEVELIDISSYSDAESFFRCSDPNHDIITNIGNDTSIFVYFDKDKTRVDIVGDNDFSVNKALRNAAFRMWILVDNDNNIIKHNCSKTDNACFQKVYNDFLKETDTSKVCNSCSNYQGGCYKCLRDNFAKPICSRDNFSIRPASYSIQISDTNESDNPLDQTVAIANNSSNSPTIANLSAGYLYKIDANATLYGSNTPALGYNTYFGNSISSDTVSSLLFQNSGPSCADKSDKILPTRFFNGKISGNLGDSVNSSSNNLHTNTNVGKYNYHLEDLNWTKVDQDRFFTKEGEPLKTFPGVNDCNGLEGPDNIPNTNDSSLYAIANKKTDKNGCGISSILEAGGKEYFDLPLAFHPYSFDLTDINLTLPTQNDNYIYTNNIDTTSLTNLNMSVQFRGKIIAQAKDGSATSNFSSGCFARDVLFDIDKNISRSGQDIKLDDIYAENINTGIDEKIFYQRQYLNSQLEGDYLDTDNSDTPLTINIVKSEFLDENNASATLRAYYNFTKIDKSVMNPVALWFSAKKASIANQISYTHMKNDYVASGYSPINRKINIYSGRLVTSQGVYSVPFSEDSVIVPIFVEAYCDSSIIDCDLHGLPTKSVRTPQRWRINTRHDSLRGEGSILSFNNKLHMNIAPDRPISLNKNSDRSDVNFTATPQLIRPTRRQIEIVPNVSWLLHNPTNDDNLADFIIEYLGGGGWGGKGNTGLVVDTNASADNILKRVEW
jgi:hypothetical protein